MSWESQLSPQEVNYYQQLFQSASQSQEGIVTGTEAVRFFASSGVPNEILSEVSPFPTFFFFPYFIEITFI